MGDTAVISEKKMIEHSAQDFLERGMEYHYPGKWKNIFPGASVIEADQIGILVVHDLEDGALQFAAGVLVGLEFSPDLVRDLGRLNCSIVVGAYVLREVERGHWSITYGIKLLYQWVDGSAASAHMIGTALQAVPGFVDRGITELSPKYGGERWGTTEGWMTSLMDAY